MEENTTKNITENVVENTTENNNTKKLTDSEKDRIYYEKNKDKLLKYQNEYYTQNKELCNLSAKRYKTLNNKKIERYNEAYYVKNREKINQRAKENYAKRKLLQQPKPETTICPTNENNGDITF